METQLLVPTTERSLCSASSGKVSPGTVHQVGGSQVQEQQGSFHCGHETVDQVYTLGGGGGVNGGLPASLHVFCGLQEGIRSSFSWDTVSVCVLYVRIKTDT